MQIIIPIASLVMLILSVVALFLLRSFFAGSHFHDEQSPVLEVCWRDYRPLDRLLDPADFEFLRTRGVAEVRIKRLRAERRKIYRQCLRSLAYDFNLIHRRVNMVLIQSRVDRPALAAELARQKLTFHRNLLKAEFRLALTACGFDRMPAIDLLEPLEVLQSHLRQLAIQPV